MRCLLFVRLSVACLLSKPGAESPAAGGSGDQYELPDFAGAFGGVFLIVEALRGLVTALCCTLVTFGAVFGSGALMVGMVPSRADRLSDIVDFVFGVFVQYSFKSVRD